MRVRYLVILSLLLSSVSLFTPTATAQEYRALSPADEHAVTNWIAGRVASARQPYCYRQSYGRGVGAPLSTCGAGHEKSGLLCYPDCREGYGGAGPVCWEHCPSDYTDTGAFCTRGASSLHIETHAADCPAHFHNTGTSCYRAWPPKSESLSHSTCPAGMSRTGAFCYSQCPQGYTNTGVSCYRGPDTIAKKSYGRGAGSPMQCAAGLEEDAGLCYSGCREGFHGVGPVCWQTCPAGRTACGAGCASSTKACVADTANMVIAPAVLAAAIMSGGAAGAAGEGVSAAEKATVASRLQALQAEYQDVIRAAKLAKASANVGHQLGQAVARWVNDYIANFSSLTTPEVDQTLRQVFGTGRALVWVQRQYALQNLHLMVQHDAFDTVQDVFSAASGFDPSGVTGVISAYMQPKCSIPEPFPTLGQIVR